MPIVRKLTVGVALLAALAIAGSPLARAQDSLKGALQKLRAVGPQGAGHEEAIGAWKVASSAPARELTTVLAAMEGANPLAENWLRSAAETIAQRERKALPIRELELFLQQTQHAPRARRLAYELVAAVDQEAEQRLIPPLIDDPSLELRRDAVALVIAQSQAALAAGDLATGIAGYRKAFTAARDLDQIKDIAAVLKKREEPVDLPRHFGFITNWQVVGPFNNQGTKGFDVAYPPEKTPFSASDKFEAEGGSAAWTQVVSTDDYGQIDLNKAIGERKGVIAYAYAEFVSDAERTVDIRLGSYNANKVWVNDELVFANHVYHAGAAVDQYVGGAKLKKGLNTILVKSAQNEQTDSWAKDWWFQLRVCDRIGTAVLSADRGK
jgi:hypothetical protein